MDEMGIVDRDEDGYRDLPSGRPLYLSLITPKGWSDFNSTGEVIAEMAKVVGIKVVHSSLNFGLYETLLNESGYTLTLTNYPRGSSPIYYFDAAFNSAYHDEQSGRYAKHYFIEPDIDALLKKYKLSQSQDEHKAIVNELESRLVKVQVTIPLYYKVETVEYNTKRFDGWWEAAENQSKVPPIWANSPMRLLQVLTLKPKETQEDISDVGQAG
ncbi:periplasmic substrate-binding domain-containing protein [Veronia nyctiphanis]|uniref:hypothetical protein n=1 Tax=Veronia nyctiphanis TaxID=1278244 RepID=UPI0022A8BDF9|nr:hypothetical protein [Veronia nyctiphanis]